MISSMLYIILVISFMSISLYICFGYIKATYAYLIDGADLRVCTISQCIIFLILMNVEIISFGIRKNVYPVDMYLFRTYISYLFYFISASRLLGYKSLFFPKKLKNAAYIVITLSFYVTTILEIFFLTKLPLPIESLSRIDIIGYIIKARCNDDAHRIIHSIPALYSLVCYLFVILFDTLEKRGYKTLLVDTLTDTPIMIYVIVSISIEMNYVSDILVIFMFIIPLISIIFEIKSILRYCSKEINRTEHIRNLINRSYKLSGARKIYNARLISKLIKQNPDLSGILPNDSKFKDFIDLIKSFGEERVK